MWMLRILSEQVFTWDPKVLGTETLHKVGFLRGQFEGRRDFPSIENVKGQSGQETLKRFSEEV